MKKNYTWFLTMAEICIHKHAQIPNQILQLHHGTFKNTWMIYLGEQMASPITIEEAAFN